MATLGDKLDRLLRDTFRLPSFRPYQKEVSSAVAAGRDVILVMPTGAGKSLCYQLPGLALGGTTLVISPLIALMEDQVGKLQTLGLAAERIHSGRDRGASRQVCRDYLDGRLDFLFIAPERLSVPGFPELLARRKPALVAVDEAHCISHWGHDFRPDYRMLGQHLPALRPAPVIALTATATPPVQDDIAAQLATPGAERFIAGFRRTNIAVEVVEMKPSARREAVRAALAEPAHRPAIVYAPTRKEADALGAELADDFPAAAYHAGMTAADRDQVQAAFATGELSVIVATIAFGMGVDKPDIRTVLHTALPGSLEGYYQEIGRAGRDGLPSRAILLYSWADRRTHEFFHGRDYPEPEVMERVFGALKPEPQPRDAVQQRARLEEEVFERALEQLWIHGGAVVHPDPESREEHLGRGDDGWRRPYTAQREHRREQLERITRFAQGHGCRMLALVQHFGDRADPGTACTLCDACAPDGCRVRSYRPPTLDEEAAAARALGALQERDGLSTGQLFRQITEGDLLSLDRRAFEEVLGALARAGLVEVGQDAFEKDGRLIHFQRASLTPRGWSAGAATTSELWMPGQSSPPAGARSRRVSDPGGSRRSRKGKQTPQQIRLVEQDLPEELVEALKAWRLAEARRRRVPAFRILTNRALLAVAQAHPRDESELLAVKGIGPALVRQYGVQILEIVQRGR